MGCYQSCAKHTGPTNAERALLGVNAAFLENLKLRLHRKFGRAYLDLTTTEICTQYVMPLTEARACAWVDLLLKDPVDKFNLAPATVFVSHAWKYSFATTVDTILRHEFREAPGAYYWIDLIPNNQHIATNLPYEWWCNTFQENIKRIGRVLLVMSPWRDPIPMTRAWCLFEMMNALHGKVQLDIRLPEAEVDGFVEALADNHNEVMDMLVRVEAQKAEAFKASDRDMIFKTVEETVGFPELNTKIKAQLRAWCLEQALVAVRNRESEDGKSMKFAHFCNQVGLVLSAFGELDKALEISIKALEICLATRGEEHIHTATMYNRVGVIYRQQHEYEQALEYHDKALKITLNSQGEEHLSTASTYNNMALVHNNLKQYESALEYYDKALKIMLATLGEEDENTAGAYNNIATVLKSQREYVKATAYYSKALKILLLKMGEKHPSTAAAYNNMAIMYKKQGQYEQALEHYDKASIIWTAVLGEEHPRTVSAVCNQAMAYQSQGQQEQALEHYRKALRIRKRTLGMEHADTRRVQKAIDKLEASS
ncbi:uncharacterized protein MONBRDRAFT_29879 [Monosiga brevicollis MX1]|uniref:Mbre TPR repeat protein n=1 Tax=Monosiga brevicollis TaxID=81824 RepID=A9VCE4_MONBE|nr:uncharacterized protein MONBRDRAFT_29879 [Monosiga brevicollis MX1]EDQ84735.1 predicted protein [Monosiga brevicollis MX1]|eukprot:XP_001750385.1 hypothetical protein [Monosiga brevicollis MX1]